MVNAREAVAKGQCTGVVLIGDRIRELDADYFEHVFVSDPAIASCLRKQPDTPSSMPDLDPEPKALLKDPSTALWLSLGVTLGGCGLIFTGAEVGHEAGGSIAIVGGIATVFGPTLGHTYAGTSWNPGVAVRLAAFGAVVGGLAIVAGTCRVSGSTQCNSDAETLGIVLAYGGLAAYVGGSIYEIATAPGAAREYNRRHLLEMRLRLAPVSARDGLAPGLALAGRF